MSEWQPIETAPKDGTDIIVSDSGELVSVAFFCEDTEMWFDSMNHNGYDHTVRNPTHWMPLPAPPHMSLKPCPKCGKKQPMGDKCVECGLEFAK
jgi:hypothetical protein